MSGQPGAAGAVRALVVLASNPQETGAIGRAIKSVEYLPGPFSAIDVAAPHDLVEQYSGDFPGRRVLSYRAGVSEDGYDVVVYLPGAEPPSQLAEPNPSLRVYRCTRWGQLVREGPLDEFDYPHFSTHAFNRLGPRTDSFRWFPYLPIELHTGLGPTNEYGHRITIDLASLYGRVHTHKVIAVFGGSATWSIFCQHDETFTSALERLLHPDPGARLTVLNFGMPGASVLYETISYLLFCHDLRPDVVISHSGLNDLANGQITDPYLLNKLHMTYYPKLEAWAQILHDADPEFHWFWSDGRIAPGNHPRAIVTAYLRRRRQFANLVRANGGLFVSGLQPLLASKNAPSAWEAAWPERHQVGLLSPILANVPHLYRKLVETLDDGDDILFADVHAHFGRFGDDMTLFEDSVHTLPKGDDHIAQFYARFLNEHVLPRMTTRAPGPL